MKTISFIGGDERQIYAIKMLSDKFSAIKIYGFDEYEKNLDDGIIVCKTPAEAAEADIVILPLPYTKDGETVNMSFSKEKLKWTEALKLMKKSQKLFAGKVDDELKNEGEKYNVEIKDCYSREETEILNSIPTAEGAVEIAMRETPHTLWRSHCLILGYGKIGKTLSKMLNGIGAFADVCVRKKRDIALCGAMGTEGFDYSELLKKIQKYDVIFNTVPAPVLGEKELKCVKDGALVIDLASKPGGVDFDVAEKLGKRIIWALSLPGKVAPKTAGEFIAEAITDSIRETEVEEWKEKQ